MKKQLFLYLIFLFPILLHSQDNKKVLIIGVDGCRPDALLSASTPNLDNLISNGIFSSDALNDDITISGPGWSAILCGVWSDKHLVTNNNFDGNDYDNYPSFFKHIDDYDAALHTVSICHWSPINDFIIADNADFKLSVNSDLAVADQAATYLSVNDPDVMFLHFDDVDHAGHSNGFSPLTSEYISAIEGVDAHIGTVIASMEQRPTFSEEDWLIIVTTDHGGLGFSHGGNSIEERNVFVIASGNNIVPAVISKDSSMEVNSVFNCLGDAMELQFDGVDDKVQIPANSLFDFGSDNDFTVECRVRTNVSGDFAIVGNKNWGSGANKGFVFSFKYPSGPEWKVNIGDGNNRADINNGGAIADNEWHTLSVSVDRDGWMKMYEDGMIVDSTDISFIGDINTNEGLSFGSDINGGYNYPGGIAEVRIWNTLLDEQALDNWHCTAIENSHPYYNNLIGYWKLNEGTGATEAIDYSSNGINGTIDGATWSSPDSVTIVYDYSGTPRLTDIVPTALAHLCIPIEESWGLEGTSIIPACVVTDIENIGLESKPKLQLVPNPTKDKVQLKLQNVNFNHSAKLEVFNWIGAKVYEQKMTSSEMEIDLSNQSPGVYFVTLRTGEQWVSERLLIH